jgi:putative ABC transport system permease protein
MEPLSRDRTIRARAWYRRLLRAYPAEFRQRFAADLDDLFGDLYDARAANAPAAARARFWIRILADTVHHALRERLGRPRRLPLRAHHARGPSIMSLWTEDARYALRALKKQPGLAATVVLTLTLAIGANSAIFTVVNAVLLRPMPFADPERVVMLYEVDARGRDYMASVPGFEDWRRALTTIEGVSLMATQSVNLTSVAEPDRLRGGFVTASFFDMLGVQPIIGRGFAAGDDGPGAAKTAVLDHATWQQRFGGDPAIVGRALVLNNEPHTIIGILPPSFEFPIAENDVWLPMSSYPVQDRSRASRNWMAFGRVRAGVSVEQADAELRKVAGDLARAYPETNAGWSARFDPFHQVSVRLVQRNLQLLAGALGFVLLIACANIANLLLARASTRQREMAVRAAVGASRARLVSQLLTENVALAVAGGALGLLAGAALTDAMLTLLPTLPRGSRIAPDATVVAFTAALSIGTGLLFGTLPALRASRTDVRAALSEGARTGDSRAMGRLRSGLVVAELALSLVLLVGAGLFIQSLNRLTGVELGFNPERVLTLEYRLPRNKYTTGEEQFAFHRRVLERIAAVPGVQVASLARAMPQSGNGSYVGFWRSEDTRPSQDAMPRAQYNVVSDDYFRAMEIPVVAGRVCDRQDTPAAPMALVVNAMMAERVWPGEPAIGKRLRAPDIPGEAVVIGVVGNTRPQLLSQPVAPQIYGCLRQQPGIFATIIARTAGEPLALSRSVQQAVWSVDPDQPMWKIRSAESLVAGAAQSQRFVTLLMTGAAALALLLAGLGTYSVLSYAVQRRAREVGVRMALGATRADVARLVLGQTAVLVAAGVLAGLAGAFALSRLVAAQLYETSARDPGTFALMAIALSVVAAVAAWLPMRRATAVDPVVTLRAE